MLSIQSIYIALFGRPADPEGLRYWTEQLESGVSFSTIVSIMGGTPEYLDRFEGLSNEEIVNNIYQSLFGREADAEGLEFFTNLLESGELDIGLLAITVLGGAQGSDSTII
jgi:hypothetical protein